MIQIQIQSSTMLGNFKSHRKTQIGKMCWEWSRTKALRAIPGNKMETLQRISNFGLHTVTEGKVLATSQSVAWLPLTSMGSWFHLQCMKEPASSSVLLGRRAGLHHSIPTASQWHSALTYKFGPAFETFLRTMHLVLIHVDFYAVIQSFQSLRVSPANHRRSRFQHSLWHLGESGRLTMVFKIPVFT